MICHFRKYFNRFLPGKANSIYQRINPFLPILVSLQLMQFNTIAQEKSVPKESPFSSKTYERFSWGVRIGPNVTLVHFADPDAKNTMSPIPAIGFVVTGIAQFRLGERYSFVTEVGYSHKTSQFSYGNGIDENKLDMQFVEFSGALRRRFNFKFSKNVDSELFFHAGPNVDYWLSGSGTMPAPYEVVFDQPDGGNYHNLYCNGVNRWLFGIDLGVGMIAPITPKQKITVELRATLGQTNLGTNSSTAYINLIGFAGSDLQQNILKSNLKTFTLSVAYTFSYNKLTAHTGHSNKDNIKKKSRSRRKK